MAKVSLYIEKDNYKVVNDNTERSYKDPLLNKIIVDLIDGYVADNVIEVNDIDLFWDDLSNYRFEMYENRIDNGVQNPEIATLMGTFTEYITNTSLDVGSASNRKLITEELDDRIARILDDQIFPVMMAKVPSKDIQLCIEDSFGIVGTIMIKLLREYGYKLEKIDKKSDDLCKSIKVEYENSVVLDINNGQGIRRAVCKIENDVQPFILFKVTTVHTESIKVFFPFFNVGDLIELTVEQENEYFKLHAKNEMTGIRVTKKIWSN
ncbi:hypothetical protein [Butyrivibrio sp. AE3006]|uniref:hypothetical protein n=1 Tax=Butyrivibrio sp. AE3006 TaxID=1280673 RepID=UPI0004050A7E|nr:hypothetical protein [Butyrivibrio sp. AE3006]